MSCLFYNNIRIQKTFEFYIIIIMIRWRELVLCCWHMGLFPPWISDPSVLDLVSPSVHLHRSWRSLNLRIYLEPFASLHNGRQVPRLARCVSNNRWGYDLEVNLAQKVQWSHSSLQLKAADCLCYSVVPVRKEPCMVCTSLQATSSTHITFSFHWDGMAGKIAQFISLWYGNLG